MRTNKRKNLIRLSVIVCIIILSLSTLMGCSSQTASKEKDGYKIAVVPKMISAGWFQRMKEGIDVYNEANGTDYYFGGTNDPADQVLYIEQLLAEDWDAICVVPYDVVSIEPVLRKAKDEGILVITHEADSMDPRYYDYDLEAFRPEDLGKHYGEELVRMTGGEGTYFQTVGSLNSVSQMLWCDAGEEYISQNSNLKQLGRYETSEDILVAYNLAKELLQAHPEINAVETSSATDIAGIARAVEELGLSGKISLVGTSLTSISGEYLKSGTIETFSLWDPADAGKAMVELAEKILEDGEDFDPNTCSLSVEGYEQMSLQDNIFYAKARKDVTVENMKDLDF